MKKFKGTTGPWEASEGIIYQDSGIQGHIAETCNFFDKDQQELNSKLIAAAPELLAALQDLIENQIYSTEKCMSLNISKAREAINKALS